MSRESSLQVRGPRTDKGPPGEEFDGLDIIPRAGNCRPPPASPSASPLSVMKFRNPSLLTFAVDVAWSRFVPGTEAEDCISDRVLRTQSGEKTGESESMTGSRPHDHNPRHTYNVDTPALVPAAQVHSQPPVRPSRHEKRPKKKSLQAQQV